MEEHSESENDWAEIFSDLGSKGFDQSILEPQIKALILGELKDIGCIPPTNHIIFFCLRKVIGSALTVGKDALRSRLIEFAESNKLIGGFLEKISAVHRQASDENDLKSLLLEKLKPSLEPDSPEVNAAMSLEVITNLYNQQANKQIAEGIDKLIVDISKEISGLFADVHEPILGWEGLDSDQSATDAIRYDSGVYEFLGREREFDTLNAFLGDLSMTGDFYNFRWLLITGAGGEGKTRLAFEFLKSLPSPWVGGKLSVDEINKLVAEQKWVPRKPTLFIIDYPAQFPAQVGKLLDFFDKACSRFDLPVRVLLMERDAGSDWYERMLPTGGNTPKIRRHIFRSEVFELGWDLGPVLPDIVAKIMRRRFDRAKLKAPSDNELISAAFAIDRRVAASPRGQVRIPRPLFAVAVAEVAIRRVMDGVANSLTPFSGLERDIVLRELIDRDRSQHWKYASGLQSSAQLEAHENLLALATLCRGLKQVQISGIESAAKKLFPSIFPTDPTSINLDLLQRMGSKPDDEFVSGMEPDILGEFFVFEALKRLRQAGVDKEFLDTAFTIQPEQVAYSAILVWRDLPEAFDEVDGLSPGSAASVEAACAYARFCVSFSYFACKVGDWKRVNSMFNRLDVLRATFFDHPEIALYEAEVIVNATHDTGAPVDWSRADSLFDRLNKLRAAFSSDEKIACADARAIVNIVNVAGKVGNWPRVEAVFTRLDLVRKTFPDYLPIALQEVDAAINAMLHAGQAGHWKLVDSVFNRLDSVRGVFPKQLEIAVKAAQATVNALNGSAKAHQWLRVDDVFSRLIVLRNSFSDSQEIAFQEATAAFDVVCEAGKADEWVRVASMLGRFDELHEIFPENQEIAVQEASASMNMINLAGKARNWGRAESMFERLDLLRAAFPDNQELALKEAGAAVTVTDDASKAGHWTYVDLMFSRLDRLRNIFPHAEEFALQEARAAVNVPIAAGEAGDWARIDSMFSRLDALRDGLPNNQEIATEDAKAVVNAINGASKKHQWAIVDKMICRMGTLRHAFPGNQKIAIEAAKAAFNVVFHACHSGEWSYVVTSLDQLHSLQSIFPNQQVISRSSVNAVKHAYVSAQQFEERLTCGFAKKCLETLMTIPLNIIYSNSRWLELTLTIVKDAHNRFGDDQVIGGHFVKFSKLGIDWSKISAPPSALTY